MLYLAGEANTVFTVHELDNYTIYFHLVSYFILFYFILFHRTRIQIYKRSCDQSVCTLVVRRNGNQRVIWVRNLEYTLDRREKVKSVCNHLKLILHNNLAIFGEQVFLINNLFVIPKIPRVLREWWNE